MKKFFYSESNGIRLGRIILIAFVALFCIVTLFSSYSIIPTGYTGVKTTFGQIDPTPVSGFTWKVPFVQSIEKVNNKQQDLKLEGRVWSETSERTAIYFENITISYTINPEYSAWIYANVSNYKNCLVSSEIVSSAIKAASKQLNSTDATNRGLIEPLATEKLQESLNEKYSEDVVHINKLTIQNVDFEDAYNQAIAQKQNAQIAYEKQQIENQKIIESANKDAEVVRIQTEYQTSAKLKQAEADAEVVKIKANAQAEANKKIAESLTPNLIEHEKMNKWNGQLPTVSGGASLINIPVN